MGGWGEEDETQNQTPKDTDVNAIFCHLRKYIPVSIKETAQVEKTKEAHIISMTREVKGEGSALEDRNVHVEMYGPFLMRREASLLQ